MTQSALAEAARVPDGAVEQWESGRRVPQVETVRALAEALRLRPADLLDVDPDGDLTLQQLRTVRGLLQAQAAVVAGLPRTTYSMIERGENVTSPPPTRPRSPPRSVSANRKCASGTPAAARVTCSAGCPRRSADAPGADQPFPRLLPPQPRSRHYVRRVGHRQKVCGQSPD
jgi:transcriptional regulator with XRE-family HTH domain